MSSDCVWIQLAFAEPVTSVTYGALCPVIKWHILIITWQSWFGWYVYTLLTSEAVVLILQVHTYITYIRNILSDLINFTSYFTYILPGQQPTPLQTSYWTSILLSLQSLVHSLVLNLVPLPHVTEHSLQLPHPSVNYIYNFLKKISKPNLSKKKSNKIHWIFFSGPTNLSDILIQQWVVIWSYPATLLCLAKPLHIYTKQISI